MTYLSCVLFYGNDINKKKTTTIIFVSTPGMIATWLNRRGMMQQLQHLGGTFLKNEKLRNGFVRLIPGLD